jgi:hypothetical protein
MKSGIESDEPQPFERSTVIKEMKEEREEIMRFKWLESERLHHDIGFEKALLGWVIRHRSTWLAERRRNRARERPATARNPTLFP